jgi:hypothetical protein
MTWFRHAVTTNTRLDIEREHETASSASGQKPRDEPGFSRTAYRRYASRNHLRSRLRHKLGRQ